MTKRELAQALAVAWMSSARKGASDLDAVARACADLAHALHAEMDKRRGPALDQGFRDSKRDLSWA
jgi:hypothetical protein